MSDLLYPDLCILGGGAAGAALAVRAANCGLSVVLVEKGSIGGTKLSVHAPGHALIAASRKISEVRAAGRFGIDVGEPRIDFERIQRQKAAVVEALAANETRARLEALNVEVVSAPGRFVGRHRLDAGKIEIEARHFVIATGAPIKVPPIRGMDLIRPLTYASLCSLISLPLHLVVLGNDGLGLALAQAFRRFGAEVTVIAETRAFAFADDELSDPVRTELAREGIVLYEGVTVSRVEPNGEGVRVFLSGASAGTAAETEPLEGSHLLLASAGAPLVEGLGLAAAGIRYDARGIVVDNNLRTTNRRIYAIGGVVSGLHPGVAAESQAGCVLNSLLGTPASSAPIAVRAVMTEPEITVAGLSESDARARFGVIRVLRWPFSETDGARYLRATGGHVKIITTGQGVIVGAGIVGSAAGELISLCALAISNHMTIADLRSMMVPYPVLADALSRAAATYRPDSGRASLLGKHLFRRLCRLGSEMS